MTLQKLKTIIKKHNWWAENMPGSFRLISGWRGFILQNKLYKQRFLSITIGMYQNDLLWEQTIWREKINQFFRILRIYQNNPKRIRVYYQEFLKTRKALTIIGEKTVARLSRLSNKELVESYQNFYQIYTEFFAWSLMPECGDAYSDSRLLSDLKKATKGILAGNELSETSIILSTFPFLSFVEMHRLEFLKLCFQKKPSYKAFSKKYHWIQNNYLKAKVLSPKYFKKERKGLLKKKGEKEIQKEIKILTQKARQLKIRQEQLIKKLHLPKNLLQIFNLLRIFSRWIDERKSGALHACYYIDEFLREISKRTSVSIELLNYYTPEEIVVLVAKGLQISAAEARSRKKLSVYVAVAKGEGFTQDIFTGKGAATIFSLFEKEKQKECKGFIANAPVQKYQGEVQIILNPHKEKFKKGRILVTTMTRPDFAPILRQAAAIITDEGGITCHAAIVSREFGIPCIIGTKIATKTFKDGDIVEVDFKKGVIKKI